MMILNRLGSFAYDFPTVQLLLRPFNLSICPIVRFVLWDASFCVSPSLSSSSLSGLPAHAAHLVLFRAVAKVALLLIRSFSISFAQVALAPSPAFVLPCPCIPCIFLTHLLSGYRMMCPR